MKLTSVTLLVALVGSASAYTAAPLRASRVAKAPLARSQVAMGINKPAACAIAGCSALALLAAAEPAMAADFIKSASTGSPVTEVIIPAGVRAKSQGILGPPGAIFAFFVAMYTATQLSFGPWKDGLPGRKMDE